MLSVSDPGTQPGVVLARPRTVPPAVDVQGVSVTYRTFYERRPTLKDALVRLGRGQRIVREVAALRDVSLQVAPGTILGVVGANGAGKSTLMRAIAGILPPTAGRITVRGRVSTLLALGVGFNPALSGRQNVVLGGLAAGLTRGEITERYPAIADFAELGDFMDLPLRTYSSGMHSRLAFSVAVHLDPDILLVDEALAAGDARFKRKATARMTELLAQARTMIMVSHALGAISEMCTSAVWLDRGRVRLVGPPGDVVAAYTRSLGTLDASVTEDL